MSEENKPDEPSPEEKPTNRIQTTQQERRDLTPIRTLQEQYRSFFPAPTLPDQRRQWFPLQSVQRQRRNIFTASSTTMETTDTDSGLIGAQESSRKAPDNSHIFKRQVSVHEQLTGTIQKIKQSELKEKERTMRGYRFLVPSKSRTERYLALLDAQLTPDPSGVLQLNPTLNLVRRNPSVLRHLEEDERERLDLPRSPPSKQIMPQSEQHSPTHKIKHQRANYHCVSCGEVFSAEDPEQKQETQHSKSIQTQRFYTQLHQCSMPQTTAVHSESGSDINQSSTNNKNIKTSWPESAEVITLNPTMNPKKRNPFFLLHPERAERQRYDFPIGQPLLKNAPDSSTSEIKQLNPTMDPVKRDPIALLQKLQDEKDEENDGYVTASSSLENMEKTTSKSSEIREKVSSTPEFLSSMSISGETPNKITDTASTSGVGPKETGAVPKKYNKSSLAFVKSWAQAVSKDSSDESFSKEDRKRRSDKNYENYKSDSDNKYDSDTSVKTLFDRKKERNSDTSISSEEVLLPISMFFTNRENERTNSSKVKSKSEIRSTPSVLNEAPAMNLSENCPNEQIIISKARSEPVIRKYNKLTEETSSFNSGAGGDLACKNASSNLSSTALKIPSDQNSGLAPYAGITVLNITEALRKLYSSGSNSSNVTDIFRPSSLASAIASDPNFEAFRSKFDIDTGIGHSTSSLKEKTLQSKYETWNDRSMSSSKLSQSSLSLPSCSWTSAKSSFKPSKGNRSFSSDWPSFSVDPHLSSSMSSTYSSAIGGAVGLDDTATSLDSLALSSTEDVKKTKENKGKESKDETKKESKDKGKKRGK